MSHALDSGMNWYSKTTLQSKSLVCAFCGNKIASSSGYKIGMHQDGSGNQLGGIYICPHCGGPNYFTIYSDQIPGPIIGEEIKHVPEDVYQLYRESRINHQNACYTSSVMICRKILMNIAVSQGADEGKAFYEYINFISEKGFIPPNGKHWVDHIRKKGNEANHEINIMSKEDSYELIMFIAMLIKFIYEFPNMLPQ